MHVLVTRPRHQAAETTAALATLGHSAMVEPLLELVELDTPIPTGSFVGIVLTSANALAGAKRLGTIQRLHNLPVLTTGQASATAALNHGFRAVDHVVGSALDLVSQVPAWMKQKGLRGQLLYPCAETTAHDLNALLGAKEIKCHHWPVYRSNPAAAFSESAIKVLKAEKIDAVLLYSRRTAHTFVQLMQQHNLAMKGLRAYVMSREIFNVLPMELQANAKFPNKPSETELLNLIGS